ncbi:MAG: hypothetical protein HOY69_37275 [Streptomyces sp.]|nr:hypothetical protein [Streptomyces sp.]
MGEFSGIDATALQGMTDSFKKDKDHLRDRASSYKSSFANYGLDTSQLTELVGICGWMDDQMPMLTRRYHLAIAADKPYPGQKTMVQIDESMVGTTAQSQKDGKALADQFDKSLDDGDDPSEELFAALKAHADDPDFLKAFYDQLGPQRLMQLTNDQAGTPYGRYGDHKDQAAADRDILAKTFGTYTKVAFEGQTAEQKQASWNKWFDKSQFPHQAFRADYMTSLLPGGSQDKDFLVALGDRVFDDKNSNRSGSQFMNGGGGKGPFDSDHYTQLFNAIAANPEASGEWMDHNYEGMQTILYPHGPWDLGQPPSRAQAFADLMKAGTINLKATNAPLAEKLTGRILMDNYRHMNGDSKDIHTYDPIDVYYGELITANWDDMVYGITSPTGNKLWGADATAGGFTQKMSQWDQKAFLAGQDPNRPGLEVGAPLWQALLNESARNPTVAGQESALFDAYRTKITNEVGSAETDTTEHAQDYRMMQSGLMMKAYSQAFEYAKGSIEGDANKWAESVNSARDAMIDFAADSATALATGGETAVADFGKGQATAFGDAAKGVMLGFVKDAVHVSPEDAPGLADKYKKINDAQLDTSWQYNYQHAANSQLTNGGFSSKVTAPVTIHPRNGQPITYTGDPKNYIKAPEDNFLNPDGTAMDIDKMSTRQRTAYNNWLMDPAIVNHVDSRGFTQQEQFQHLSE